MLKFEAIYQTVTFGYPRVVAGAGERRDWQPGEIHDSRDARYTSESVAKGQATRWLNGALPGMRVLESRTDAYGWTRTILQVVDGIGAAQGLTYAVATRITNLETGERVAHEGGTPWTPPTVDLSRFAPLS